MANLLSNEPERFEQIKLVENRFQSFQIFVVIDEILEGINFVSLIHAIISSVSLRSTEI